MEAQEKRSKEYQVRPALYINAPGTHWSEENGSKDGHVQTKEKIAPSTPCTEGAAKSSEEDSTPSKARGGKEAEGPRKTSQRVPETFQRVPGNTCFTEVPGIFWSKRNQGVLGQKKEVNAPSTPEEEDPAAQIDESSATKIPDLDGKRSKEMSKDRLLCLHSPLSHGSPGHVRQKTHSRRSRRHITLQGRAQTLQT